MGWVCNHRRLKAILKCLEGNKKSNCETEARRPWSSSRRQTGNEFAM